MYKLFTPTPSLNAQLGREAKKIQEKSMQRWMQDGSRHKVSWGTHEQTWNFLKNRAKEKT